MKNLSRFSPAETLVLLEGKNASLKELLKVTLMDLFLKRALQTAEITNPSGSKSLPVSNTYVVKGSDLDHYRAKAHENVFLNPFYKNAEARLLFSNLVKIGYGKARNEKNFRRQIFKNNNLDPYFQRNFFTWLTGRLLLTPSGKRMLQDIQAEIRELETSLPHLMEHERSKTLEIMKTLGGNIFLIKGVDLKLMKEIDHHLVTEDIRSKSHASDSSSASDTMTWVALDTHAHDFDNSCSNTGSDSGGGDSGGDSGCSGCGGCGGD